MIDKWLELVEGKTVCLVGNSKSVCGKSLGSIIDGHDIVCRFNVWSTCDQEIDVGVKTGVWVVSTSLISRWKGWEEHFSKQMAALEWVWEWEGGVYNFAKIQEMWFVPNIVNPTSIISAETLKQIPETVKVRLFHHGPYMREIYDARRDKTTMFSCGLRVVAAMIHHRSKLRDLTVAGFGERNPEKRLEQREHYFHEVFEKPMEQHTDMYAQRYPEKIWGPVHDLDYEHDVMNNWIDQGLIRRLEDESYYSV